MKTRFRYLFGPVPSRRFGRSLGVDLIPHKTCSLDCVFCQLGQTSNKTTIRKEYTPTADVLSEIDNWFASDGRADFITLSGSGEPTLHSKFGKILEYIKTKTDIPSLLLTNGSLLHLPEVREAASVASTIKISLSAWHQASFEWVNRPPPQLNFDQLLEGQKSFRKQYKGQLYLEVFLVPGMNAMPKDVRKIARLAKEIAPDRIQLNTAVRPSSEDFVTPLPRDRMEKLTRLFEPKAEIIADYQAPFPERGEAGLEMIVNMLQRRPCTSKQIAAGLGIHLNSVLKYLNTLMQTHPIHTKHVNNKVYYLLQE